MVAEAGIELTRCTGLRPSSSLLIVELNNSVGCSSSDPESLDVAGELCRE